MLETDFDKYKEINANNCINESNIEEIVTVQSNITSIVIIIKICSTLLEFFRSFEITKTKEKAILSHSSSESPVINKGETELTESPSKKMKELKPAAKIIDKQSALEICDLFVEIAQVIKKITININHLSISQDRLTLNEKIGDALQGLNQFDRKAKRLMEALPEKGDDIFETVETLKTCKEVHTSLIDFIKNKKNKLMMDCSLSSTELLVWSNFFQFTENNYFLLDDTRKERLMYMLLEGEKKFEVMIEEQSKMTFILPTYISILVQKQPLLLSEEEKEKNSRKIKTYCYIYTVKFKENLNNNKTLNNILTSNNHEKTQVKQVNNFEAARAIRSLSSKTLSKTLSPKLLSPHKPQVEQEKEKVDEMIERIISRCSNANSQEIKIMLESHNKKSLKNKDSSHLKLIKNISDTFEIMRKSNLTNHKLTYIHLLKISYLVESGFFFNSFESFKNQGKVFQDGNLFLIKETDFLNRSILIDSSQKSFTVLSKLHGDLKKEIIIDGKSTFIYIKGGVKKISAAASFFWEGNTVIHRETILATPIKGKVFDTNLIKYLYKFNDQKGLTGCRYYMEYKPDEQGALPKQLLIQDREAGDLTDFIQENDFTKKETWEALLSIIADIAAGLNYMHSQGDIHWDLKFGNILYNKIKGKINDYDTSFNARNGEQPGWLQPAYGSSSYAAPEINFETLNSQKISEEEAKRRDMYGFGCMLIDILDLITLLKEKKSIDDEPNKRRIYQKVADQELQDEMALNIPDSSSEEFKRLKRLAQEKAFERLLANFKIFSMTHEKFIEFIAYKCIHPNPVQRWNIIKLIDEVGKFQLKQIK